MGPSKNNGADRDVAGALLAHREELHQLFQDWTQQLSKFLETQQDQIMERIVSKQGAIQTQTVPAASPAQAATELRQLPLSPLTTNDPRPSEDSLENVALNTVPAEDPMPLPERSPSGHKLQEDVAEKCEKGSSCAWADPAKDPMPLPVRSPSSRKLHEGAAEKCEKGSGCAWADPVVPASPHGSESNPKHTSVSHTVSFQGSITHSTQEVVLQQLRHLVLPSRQSGRGVAHFRERRASFESHGSIGSLASLMQMQQERNLQWFVSSNMFSTLCSVVILANAVFVGVHTEYSLRSVLEGGRPLNWVVADAVFCVWFAFELGLRVIASPHTFCCGRDWKWNHFDVLLVLNYLVDVALQAQGGGSRGSSFATMRILRAFRMTRILRLIRVMRFFRSLRLMIYSIIQSLVSLLWVFLLLLFAMYVFAIYFLNVVSDAFQSAETVDATVLSQLRATFSSVVDALLTLFMSIAGGVDWQAVIRPLIELHWAYGVMFFIYVFFVVFGVLNVVTGAFVDSMRLVSQRDVDVVIDDAMKKENEYKDDVKRIFLEADTDMSGTLSWEEFEEHLQDSRVKAYLTSLGLDVKHAKAMFMLLDVDECNAVEINEFVDGCMRLKGGATSIDVNMLLYENEKLLCKVDSYSRFAKEKFARLEAVLGIPPDDSTQSQRLSRRSKEARGHVTNRLDHAAEFIRNMELGEAELPRITAYSASALRHGVDAGSMDSSRRSSLASDGFGRGREGRRTP